MKQIQVSIIFSFTLFFFFPNQNVFGQYLEQFATPNKGILAGTCAGTFASCTSDFSGVSWTINGDFSGMDGDDFLSTNGTGVLDMFGDTDGLICFETPALDILIGSAVSISIDFVWTSHDGSDFVDVEYNIDGGGWVPISNQFGGGTHTIDFSTSGNSGSGTVTQTGLNGNSMSLRVCTSTNSSGDNTTIDNVSVPEAGVTIIGSIPVVSISTVTSIIPENGSINLVYRFSRTGDTSGTLPVNFGISGTASSSDFSVMIIGSVSYNSGAGTGTITFPANEITVDLIVSSIGDLTVEADETVTVTILP